jgi:hypothetical protein
MANYPKKQFLVSISHCSSLQNAESSKTEETYKVMVFAERTRGKNYDEAREKFIAIIAAAAAIASTARARLYEKLFSSSDAK